MNKSELTKFVADNTGIRLTEAAKVVDTVFDTITDTLRKGNPVVVSGFGTFTPKTRAAREGRNPSTGQVIQIPKRTTATFKPAAVLKDIR